MFSLYDHSIIKLNIFIKKGKAVYSHDLYKMNAFNLKVEVTSGVFLASVTFL